MKSSYLLLSTAAVAAAALLTINNVRAQQTIATWFPNPLVNGGGAPPAPFAPNYNNPNVKVSSLTKGAGIGAVTTSSGYGGNDWTNAVLGTPDSEANSISTSNYIVYAVQAMPGYTISFATNIIWARTSSTGPGFGELQYSTDGVNYSDILSFNNPGGASVGATVNGFVTNILSGIPALQNVPSTTTNYFRIVNWGATGTAGTWYIWNTPGSAIDGTNSAGGTNDFAIFGNVQATPQNIAAWNFTALPAGAGGAPPAPEAANTSNPNLIITPMTKGAGIGVATGFGAYGGNNWTNPGVADSEANSIATSNYIVYAVRAATNYTVSFYTNIGYFHNSATGPWNGELQYSTDGVSYTDIAFMAYTNGNVAASDVLAINLSAYSFLQNVPSTTTNFFRIVNWGATGSAGTWYIYDPPPAGTLLNTNDFAVIGGVTSLQGIAAPSNVAISPTSQSVNAGQTASFTITASGGPPAYFWYYVANSMTNFISGQTNATLSLTNVIGADAGGYFAVLTNSAGSATSAVATLTILNDPTIQVQPNDTYGLLDGQAQFTVIAAGTTPSYQWYFADASGNLIAPVTDGNDFQNQSGVVGSQSSMLTITNLQYADLTNFVVVVSTIYGAQTSSVASLLGVTNADYVGGPPPYSVGAVPIAFWDFNGSNFIDSTTNPNCLFNPVPYLGAGTASAVGSCYDPGTSPFAGSVDGNDDTGFDDIIPGVDHLLDYSWGTDNYPASGRNKQNGVQFNVSTAGAKNIHLSYQSRVSATASDYERVQYTTDGTSWVDYPSSFSFNGVGTTYEPYSADFSGFPGAANNPNFGVRIVTECQGTATYGVTGTSSNYLGTANSYGTAGTVTYDLVGLFGDAITNDNVPPVISAFTNAITLQVVTNTTFETTVDTTPVTNTFTVSGDTDPTTFSYSAVSLNTPSLSPSFAINVNHDGSGTLVITPNKLQGINLAAGPILFSATDTNGDVAKAWFDLTVVSANPPPTNTLTALSGTNTLVNTTLTVPFNVGSASNPVSQLTYTTSSDNNNVVPDANITVGNQGTTNPRLMITPGSNQLGVAILTVTVNDNNSAEPKSTTANIPFIVRPDTNVVAIDYFNYDNSGSLDSIASGFWNHLSGNFGQMQVNSSQSGGSVTVDTFDNTENLQTPLLGAPYSTNGQVGTLYYSFVVNMENANNMPNSNGTYIAALNDGAGNTAHVEDLFMVGTNGAAPGDYRIGIGNDVGDTTASNSSVAIFPQDLVLNSNYVVVTAVNLKTGQSTVWLNPTSLSSPSVSPSVDSGTVAYNISDFELRESGGESGDLAGAVNVSYVKVGTTFASVLQTPQIQNAVTYTVPFGSVWDVAITNLQTAAGWSDPNNLILSLENAGPTSADGANITTDGVNIYYSGPVVSYDSFSYVIGDGYMTASGLVSLKPVLQFNGSQGVNGNGNPVISGTSPVGAANYVYGVEDTTNLLTGPWIEAGSVTVGPTGAWSFTDTTHTKPPVIFYRLYYPDDPSNPPQ